MLFLKILIFLELLNTGVNAENIKMKNESLGLSTVNNKVGDDKFTPTTKSGMNVNQTSNHCKK